MIAKIGFRITYFITYLVFFFMALTKAYSDFFEIALSIFVLLDSILFCISCRKNFHLFLLSLFLFYFNYSILFCSYLHLNEATFYSRLAHTEISFEGIKILSLCTTILYVFFPFVKSPNGSQYVYGLKKNIPIAAIIFVVLIVIFIFGFDRPSSFSERGTPSTFYEYSLILFIFAFYYSGKDKRIVIPLVALLFLYCGNNFLYGGRITALQELICIYLIIFEPKIKKVFVVIGALFAFLVMTVIGEQRGGFTFGIEMFQSAIEHLKIKAGALDTAYSAYYTSLTFIQYKQLGFNDNFSIFFKTVLSVFAGGSLVKGSNLAEITHDYFNHDYGGVYPFFGYFYFGFFGVALYSFYLVFILHKSINDPNRSDFFKLFGIYVISSCPRWFLYSTAPLTRSLFIFVIVYFGLKLFDNTINRKKSTEKVNDEPIKE